MPTQIFGNALYAQNALYGLFTDVPFDSRILIRIKITLYATFRRPLFTLICSLNTTIKRALHQSVTCLEVVFQL